MSTNFENSSLDSISVLQKDLAVQEALSSLNNTSPIPLENLSEEIKQFEITLPIIHDRNDVLVIANGLPKTQAYLNRLTAIVNDLSMYIDELERFYSRVEAYLTLHPLVKVEKNESARKALIISVLSTLVWRIDEYKSFLRRCQTVQACVEKANQGLSRQISALDIFSRIHFQN